MCNRYSSTKNEARLTLRLGTLQLALSPRYNIAPTHRVPAVIAEAGELATPQMRWGFTGYNRQPVTNAKSESARFKPMFRNSWAQRRCIIPADGFYEWKTEGRRKDPYRFVVQDEAMFWFAGLWNSETRLAKTVSNLAMDEDEDEHAFVILTKDANADVRRIHNRMPLILASDEIESWLSAETSREWIPAGIPEGSLRSYLVGSHVSTPGLETADCIKPAVGVAVQAELW